MVDTKYSPQWLEQEIKKNALHIQHPHDRDRYLQVRHLSSGMIYIVVAERGYGENGYLLTKEQALSLIEDIQKHILEP